MILLILFIYLLFMKATRITKPNSNEYRKLCKQLNVKIAYGPRKSKKMSLEEKLSAVRSFVNFKMK